MPNNRRPQGYLVTDIDYQGTTIAERRQMQNTWDLLEQQEIANKLTAEKIKQDSINAKLQAEATIQAAKEAVDREYDNKIRLENQKFLNELELELIRQNHDKLMRYNQLCDKYNLNYDDIKEITNYLNKRNPKIDNEIEKNKIELSKVRQRLNKLKNPITQYNQERLSIKGQINKLNYKIANYVKDTSFIIKLFNNKKYKNKLNIYKDEINLLNKRLQELDIKLDNIDDTEYTNRRNLIMDKINLYTNKIDELENKNNEYIADNYKEFAQFRSNHYNEEIEDLFEKLDLHLFKIKDDDIKKKGTIEDYRKYIKKLKDR